MIQSQMRMNKPFVTLEMWKKLVNIQSDALSYFYKMCLHI